MAIKILNDLLPIAEQTEVGVVKPDNVSITITETGELQSSVVDLPEDVVTAENYDNPKLWKGTLEEYNAIETKNPLVTYIITDDNVETLKTTDYNALSNKPSINDVTLEGNKTLEELNIQPADTSLTTSQITNCITKIPQDIKLELSTDGTLTLKAGSKVYVPNGKNADDSNRFDEVNFSQDIIIILSTGLGTTTLILFSTLDGTAIGYRSPENCESGTTDPEEGSGINYYNTQTNILTAYNALSSSAQMSFPIAKISIVEDKITSIDQVFNGFGYIGSTIFALPGIEGLIPNGFNIDTKKLENIKVTTDKVNIFKVTDNTKKYILMGRGWFLPSAYFKYNNIQNYNYDSEDHITLGVCCGTYISDSTGRITSFNPKTTFNAIDRNDTEWASTASKPSNRYIDLTLGASGSTYTAPANGWFSINLILTGRIKMFSNTQYTCNGVIGNGNNAESSGCSIPVVKNDIVYIVYNDIGNIDWFRFIYDEGVK